MQMLADPVVQSDPLLRIRGLALLGAIDLNLNSAAAFAGLDSDSYDCCHDR